MTSILVLDDDEDFCCAMREYLVAHGCFVRTLQQASDLHLALADETPDLLLLDQRLGATTGTEVLRALRRNSDVPCIIVTGISDSVDRIVNLELGADDEISKGTEPRELLARIRAVLRRTQGRAMRPAVTSDAGEGGWQFSVQQRDLRRPDGTPCHLTSAEFETLRMLVEAAGRPVSRALLCEQVFGRAYEVSDRAVDTVVGKLRRKVGGAGGVLIKTVRSNGYVFSGFPAVPEP